MAHLTDKRKKGWLWMETELIDDLWLAAMGPEAFSVYAVLARRVAHGHSSFPIVQDLALWTGMTTADVITAVKKLEEMEIIMVLRGGNNKPSSFQLMPVSDRKKPESPEVPIRSTTQSRSSDRAREPLQFAKLWEAYPRKSGVNQKQAIRSWNARIAEGHLSEVMVAGALRYAAYCKAMGTEENYVKHPATFLGPDLHFLDDWKATTRSGGKPGVTTRPDELMEFYDKEEVV